MNLDNLHKLWESQQHGTINCDPQSMLTSVRQKQQKLRTTVFWRDVREIVVGLILIPVFYLGAQRPEQPWTLYLPIPAILFVISFIVIDRLVQKRRRVTIGETNTAFIKQAIGEVSHQAWLLRNVIWWYLLPIYLAINIYFVHVTLHVVGDAPYVWIPALLPVAVCTVVYYGIYKMNQYVVKKDLEPRLQELLAIQADLKHTA